MKNEKLYRKALELAVECEREFLRVVEHNHHIEDALARERQREALVIPAANRACAQQELIASLFNVSDEKVHEDIRAIIATNQ